MNNDADDIDSPTDRGQYIKLPGVRSTASGKAAVENEVAKFLKGQENENYKSVSDYSIDTWPDGVPGQCQRGGTDWNSVYVPGPADGCERSGGWTVRL